MVRLFLVILIVVLILSALFLPRFRRALWVTLGILICVITLIIWIDYRDREIGTSRLSPAQVALLNMQVRPGLNSRSYVVNGRIRNNSPDFTLTAFFLKLTLKDCRSEECETIGQEQNRVPIEVPPGQSRDFEVSVPFPFVVAVQGKPEWTYEVVRINAR